LSSSTSSPLSLRWPDSFSVWPLAQQHDLGARGPGERERGDDAEERETHQSGRSRPSSFRLMPFAVVAVTVTVPVLPAGALVAACR
jgi:hypothetical protein